MKKHLLFAGALLALSSGVSKAQIENGTIGNGTFVDWSGYSSTKYGLDFDGDGNLEFALSNGETSAPSTNCTIMWKWAENGNNVCTVGDLSAGGWDEVDPLEYGTAINASSNWEGQGDAYLVNYYDEALVPLNQDFYVGLRLKINNNTHYGWAKVKLTGNASSGFNATWSQIAYNVTPNAVITAGQTGVGITSYNNINVRLYPNPATDALQISSDEPVMQTLIYDMNGKCCLSSQMVGNRVDVSNLVAGTYFMHVATEKGTTVVKFVKE